jgi:hypothetical protein
VKSDTQIAQQLWLSTKDAAVLFIRNVKKPPNRVILEGCFSQFLASRLQNEIQAIVGEHFLKIEGRSKGLWIKISVEDDAFQTPYRLDSLSDD